MNKEHIDQVQKEFVESFRKLNQIENPFNKGDELPFAYFNPNIPEGQLTWICSTDPDSKIVSVFSYNQGIETDKQCSFITKEQAINSRDELVKNGWKQLVPPRINFTYNEDGKEKTLDRKQRRFLKRKIEKLRESINHNPTF
jgi:hypothetical protein